MRRKLANLLLNWLLNAFALLVISHLVPGFHLKNDIGSALAAALVIGILNVTLGWTLKFITLPISSFTFGAFLLVINAGMFLFASRLLMPMDGSLPDFKVDGPLPAFVAALELTLLQMLYRTLQKRPDRSSEN